MTTELVQKLIAHYEMVVGKVKECDNISNAGDILLATNTLNGICNCSDSFFGESIEDNEWVMNQCPSTEWYWGDPPGYYTTIPQILTALQLRIDILKTFPALKASI